MAVDTAHFHPYRTEVICPLRHLNAHDFLNRHTVAKSVTAAADAADPLSYITILFKISLLYKFLKSSVDISDTGNRLYHSLILQYQIQMNRLRQYRMLRTKRVLYFSLPFFSTPSS